VGGERRQEAVAGRRRSRAGESCLAGGGRVLSEALCRGRGRGRSRMSRGCRECQWVPVGGRGCQCQVHRPSERLAALGLGALGAHLVWHPWLPMGDGCWAADANITARRTPNRGRGCRRCCSAAELQSMSAVSHVGCQQSHGDVAYTYTYRQSARQLSDLSPD
jgi:hypothetical protein